MYRSRFRRSLIFLLPGSMIFLFGVMGVLIARTNPIDPDGKDLTTTWWGIGIGALVIGGVLLACCAFVPGVSKKKQKLDPLPVVPHRFASWHVRTVRQGPVHHKYHVFVASSDDKVYVGNNVVGALVKDVSAASQDGKLPHVLDEGMIRPLRRHLKVFSPHEVQAVGVRGDTIALVTSGGVEQIAVSSQGDQIAAHLAELLVADSEVSQVAVESAGLISKKVKQRGLPWTLYQPSGADLAASLT